MGTPNHLPTKNRYGPNDSSRYLSKLDRLKLFGFNRSSLLRRILTWPSPSPLGKLEEVLLAYWARRRVILFSYSVTALRSEESTGFVRWWVSTEEVYMSINKDTFRRELQEMRPSEELEECLEHGTTEDLQACLLRLDRNARCAWRLKLTNEAREEYDRVCEVIEGAPSVFAPLAEWARPRAVSMNPLLRYWKVVANSDGSPEVGFEELFKL